MNISGPIYGVWAFVLFIVIVAIPIQAQELVGRPGPLKLGALFAEPETRKPKATVFRFLERSVFGSQWPLISDTAYIGCARPLPRVTVIVVLDGKAWAVNSESKSWFKDNSSELEVGGEKIAVNVGPQQEPWLADNPEFPGTQKSVAPLLDIAKHMGCLPKIKPPP
jgi:hypothetical protein